MGDANYDSMSDAELEAQIADIDRQIAESDVSAGIQSASDSIPARKPVEDMTLDEINAELAGLGAGGRLTREERIARNNAAMVRALQPGEGETTNVWEDVGQGLKEGIKGAGRAVKSIGEGLVGMASGAARLAGSPARMMGWDGLHRLADGIDEGYRNWGADALESDYGAAPDDWGFALGRAGEKIAGVAGSLAGLGAAGRAAVIGGKLAGGGKAASVIARNLLPAMFGNDAAVRTYDIAMERDPEAKGRALGLAAVNGAIHFLGFKAFENHSLNKMLGMPQTMEAMMPAWANAARGVEATTFTGLANGVRNGMLKYILAERGKGALKAGGIMGLQNFLSSIPTQMAEGGEVDLGRAAEEGLHGVGEGALMEGLMGGAAMLKSPKAAKDFISDRIFRKGYMLSNGAEVKGLLESPEGRQFVMKQNPEAQRRILDIVSHGGDVTPEELDAACLPPDMTKTELKRFVEDWNRDLAVEETRGEEGEFLGDGDEQVSEHPEQRRGEMQARARANEQRDREQRIEEAEMGERLESQFAEANAKADAERAEEEAMAPQLAREDAYPRAEPPPAAPESRGGAETGNEPPAPAEAPEGGISASGEAAAEPTVEAVAEPPVAEPPVAERPNRLRRNIKATNFRHGKGGESEQQPAQEQANETGNGAAEAPAQPEQAVQGRPGGAEAPRPVEAEPPRPEKPDAGMVEGDARRELMGGSQNLTEPMFENEQLEKAYRLIQGGDAEAGEALALETVTKMKGRDLDKLGGAQPHDKASGAILDIASNERSSRWISDEPIDPDGPTPDPIQKKSNNKLRPAKPQTSAESAAPKPSPASPPALAEGYATRRGVGSSLRVYGPDGKLVGTIHADGSRTVGKQRLGEGEVAPWEPKAEKVEAAEEAQDQTNIPKPEKSDGGESAQAENEPTQADIEREKIEIDAHNARIAEEGKKILAWDSETDADDVKTGEPIIDKTNIRHRLLKKPLVVDVDGGYDEPDSDFASEDTKIKGRKVSPRVKAAFSELMEEAFDDVGGEGLSEARLIEFAKEHGFDGLVLQNLHDLHERGWTFGHAKVISFESNEGRSGRLVQAPVQTAKQAAETPVQVKQAAVQATQATQEPVQESRKAPKLRTQAEADAERAAQDVDAAEKQRLHDEKIRGNRVRKAAEKVKNANGDVDGLSLGELETLYNDKGWHKNLGLGEAEANAVRDTARMAYEERYLGSKKGGRYPSVVTALDWLKRRPDDAHAIAKAHDALSGALDKAKANGDTLGEKMLTDRLESLNDRIGALPANKQNAVAKELGRIASQMSAMERKGRKSITTSEGKDMDIATEGGGEGEVADEVAEAKAEGRDVVRSTEENSVSDESFDSQYGKKGRSDRLNAAKENDDDATNTSVGAVKGATGKGGSRAGKNVLRVESVDGDNVTVSLLDSTGRDRGVTRTMTRAQWETLARAAKENLNNADPSNPEDGDAIRMSRPLPETPEERKARFDKDADYQRWLKKRGANDAERLREEYELEQAKGVEGAFKNAIRGIETEIVTDRDYDPAIDNPKGGKEIEDPESGRVVGIFNRDTNELKLFRGASWKTFNHEFGHALRKFAEQEAARGNRALLNKINEAIDDAPQWLKGDVRKRYGQGEKESDADYERRIRDEIFAAIREKPSEAMEKYVKTLQGRRWYNRAWDAIKTAWKGLLAKMGLNRADLSGIDKMTPGQFNDFLDRTMMEGKTLGRLEKGEAGNALRKAFVGEAGARNLGIGKLDDAQRMEKDGASREDIWRKTGWWKGKDGKWRIECSDIGINDGVVDDIRDYFLDSPPGLGSEYNIRLDRLVQNGDRLFDAYPKMRDTKVRVTDHGIADDAAGSWDRDANTLTISSSLADDARKLRKTLVHEIQHGIQVEEGFSEGSNISDEMHRVKNSGPVRRLRKEISSIWYGEDGNRYARWIDENRERLESLGVNFHRGTGYETVGDLYKKEALSDSERKRLDDLDRELATKTSPQTLDILAFDRYHRTMGEVESRNVQKRLDMSPEERAAIPPWETEDVPEDRQIVRRGNGAAESVADNRLRVQKEKGLDNGGIMGGDTPPRKEDDNELQARRNRLPKQGSGDGVGGEQPQGNGSHSLLAGASAIGRRVEGRVPPGPRAWGETEERSQAKLIEYAKKNGVWSDDVGGELDAKYGTGEGQKNTDGGESVVWFDRKRGVAVKAIGMDYYNSPILALERIELHNKYFPRTRLSLVGFGGVKNAAAEGEEPWGRAFNLVVEQPIVDSARLLTKAEIRSRLEAQGFRFLKDRGSAGIDMETPDGKAIVSDLHERNVFGTKDGGVAVIDCDIRYKPGIERGESSPVREARAPRPAGYSIMDDQQSKGEKAKERFIDSLAPVQSVQDDIGGVKEEIRADGYTDHTKSTDLVAAKDKANGRIEHEMRDLRNNVADAERDVAKAALKGQSGEQLMDDFNLYLSCKHAAERNRSVAKDRGDDKKPGYKAADYFEGMGKVEYGGSLQGLSENLANRILSDLTAKYGAAKIAHFEDAAKRAYKIAADELKRRYDGGLLSKADYDFYHDRVASGEWEHYIPLKTDRARLAVDEHDMSMAGSRLHRNEYRKARGRGENEAAIAPFTDLVLQAEQGIRKSVANEVANVEANLVELAHRRGFDMDADGKPLFAEIVPGDDIGQHGKNYQFTFADGSSALSEGGSRLVANHPEIHLFKRDGRLYAIRYNKGANGRGLAYAKAASGENMGRWGGGLEWIPKMTHWMSAMRTQYSPEFTISNLLADHLEAAQALVGRYGIKDGLAKFGRMVASEARNFSDLRAYLKNGTLRGDVREAILGGLLTKGGVASEGYEGTTKSIRSRIEEFRRKEKAWREMTPADMLKSGWKHAADFLSFANELAEYSTRMGIFSALRRGGVPVNEAVKFARDATVNFNRKGTAMPYINGLYMFANASVQGAVRSVQAMQDAHGKQLIGALVAIGVAKAVIDNYIGNDDDREKAGGRNARNLSEYDKKHNVGVPIGGGRQFVPLRFRGPYAAIPYLAQTAANVAMGVTSAKDGAKTLVRELGDQVTDIVGGNGIMNDKGEFDKSLITQSIAPSVADPFVQLASGKDYKGDDRLRRSFSNTAPQSWNGKRNTALGYKVAAQLLNRLSGGNENRKGLADIAPEDLQLVVEFLGGGPMRDANNVISSVGNAVQLASGGTPERTLSQIPFVRRIVREYPESTSRYYSAVDAYEADKAELKGATDAKHRAELRKGKPYLVTGKGRVDNLIERIKDLTHLERGEIKRGRQWVEPKMEIGEKQRERHRKERLRLQAQVLRILGQ